MTEREKLIVDLKELLTRTIYSLDAINISRAIAALSEPKSEPIGWSFRPAGVQKWSSCTKQEYENREPPTAENHTEYKVIYDRPQPLQGSVKDVERIAFTEEELEHLMDCIRCAANEFGDTALDGVVAKKANKMIALIHGAPSADAPKYTVTG